MDLTPPRAVVLIDASDYLFNGRNGESTQQPESSRIQRQAQFIISSVVSFFHLSSETICAYIGEGTVAVLKATNTKNLTPWVGGDRASDDVNSSWANLEALKRAATALLARLRNDTQASVSVAIGRYHPGLRGLAHSYRDARAALTLGRRLRGHNRIHCLDDMGVAGICRHLRRPHEERAGAIPARPARSRTRTAAHALDLLRSQLFAVRDRQRSGNSPQYA